MAGIALGATVGMPARAQVSSEGCLRVLEATVTPRPRRIVSLDAYERRGIAAMVRLERAALVRFYGVEPRYQFDMAGSNADFYYPNGTPTMITIGDGIIEKKVMTGTQPLVRLSGLLAHETAHWYQVQHGIEPRLRQEKRFPVKYIELHADYMAGAYAAWRSPFWKGAPTTPEETGEFFFHIGDENENDADHHGFKPHRYHAFRTGFADFQAYHKNENPVETIRIASRGFLYVRQNHVR